MARRTVIIGNGVAGITAAMTLRARDSRSRITVVSAETDYFFSRTALMYAFMDKLERRDLEPFERKVWERQSIERVRGRVVDLDATAHTVTLEAGATLEYDRLLLATGSVPRRLPVVERDPPRAGVVNFVSMQDLDACEALAHSTRQGVVVGGGLIGIELVECMLHHGIKTTFVVREPWYWPVALCREEGETIGAHMRHHGVDVRTEDELVSVERDGDGRVRGVTTKAGAVLPCQMLGVAIGVEPATDFLTRVKTPPRLGRGIVVDEFFRTSLPDVWSAGDCAEIQLPGAARSLLEQIWYSAKRHGELVAKNMSGRAEAYRPPIFFNSAKFFDVEYTTVGDLLALPPGTRGLYRKHASKPISQRVLHSDGRVVGFNMLGSRWDHTVLSRWIDEQRDTEWVIEHLRDAQFDVEFGRADLGAMVERELDVVAPAAQKAVSS